KPPHLIPREERDKVVKLKEMYIDIGVTNKDELDEAGVRVGDPIIPRADFVVLSNKKSYLSKAFDDRVGVALMISVLQNLQKEEHPNSVYAAATVLEEVNLGGAKTSADVINPDVALILETGLAGDVPGVKPDESAVKLGIGPAILLYDPRMVPNLKLRDFVLDTARDIDVPVQTQVMLGGTTDGAVIHLHKTGVPTIVIGVPARHIHSHSSIIHREDYDWTVQLIQTLVTRMDEKTVKEFVK
ncbi:MAG: M20/M25/M40 family metallo-hydrolase, partial [Anaerolineaceae bacterium]|nr:M20/M25/M40 family metallo-hydrolase [Anaerolineaceae bacterium]